MSYFKQFGKLSAGFQQLTPGSLGPVALITPGSDEWVDVYSIIISTNDTTLQSVTIDDGTNTLGVYYVGGTNTTTILDISTIPTRGKKGGPIRAAVGAVTAAKSVSVKVAGLISKT